MEYKLSNGSVVGRCSVVINSLQASSLGNVSFSITSSLSLLNFTSLVAPMNTD